MANQHYDLLVIGSGLAGQKGTINAAKRGKQVALLEREGSLSVTGGWAAFPSTTAPFRAEP